MTTDKAAEQLRLEDRTALREDSQPLKPVTPTRSPGSDRPPHPGEEPRRYLLYVTQLYEYAILRPLQNAIRAQGDEAAWFVHNVSDRYLRRDERQLGTVREVKAYQPVAVFTPSNLIPDFFPGVKVDVFHGFDAEKRDPHVGHFRIRGLYDLYCTQGPATTDPFRELEEKHGHFRVAETGWPKLDPFFRGDERARPLLTDDTRPTVLYTSTFSRRLTSAPALYETIRRLAAEGRWRWLINLHPKMDRRIVEAYRALEDDNVRFVETDDILPLLRAADVMVSDTSSVLKEFLVLGKPVVTFRNRRPGPHLLDIQRADELAPAIERALTRPAGLMDAVQRYADFIHPYRDGRSSERVLAATDEFLAHYHGRLRRKPLNLVRKIRLRRRLRYFAVS